MTRIKPLENLEYAFGSDLLPLTTGHEEDADKRLTGNDEDADRRQRNREFVSSGNYKPKRKWMYTLLKYPRQEGTQRQNLDYQPPNLIPSSAQYRLWIQPVRYPNRMRLGAA
jgi:hypothetical protein